MEMIMSLVRNSEKSKINIWDYNYVLQRIMSVITAAVATYSMIMKLVVAQEILNRILIYIEINCIKSTQNNILNVAWIR